MTTDVKSVKSPPFLGEYPSEDGGAREAQDPPHPVDVPPSRAAGDTAKVSSTAAPDSAPEVKTALDRLFENIEDIVGLLRNVLSKLAGSSRTIRGVAADEAHLRGLAAAGELKLQGEENVKAGQKQLEAANKSGFMKLLTFIVAIVVLAVAAAGAFFTGGASLVGALALGATLGGLAFGGGMALNAVEQGQMNKAAAKHSYQAGLHEAAAADFQAWVSKLKDQEERAHQDYGVLMQALDTMSELVGELRGLLLHNGF